jgi:hypothetical protein
MSGQATVSCAALPAPHWPPMSSSLLKWIANGVIAVVLMSTLWLAQAVHSGEHGPSLMLAQVVAPAAAASAATTSR